ncbi:DNA methyltransferase [uncultured Hymenobacter sp.]|uniref:DNA methyltransferase n=1 Tax=uncultured Hymenobacter sp. TaxID=170016 RepID=UPI0035C97570
MTELRWEGKYLPDGRRATPLRLALPFQTVETVNESAQLRQDQYSLFAQGKPTEWRNRLIWGDKKYVLPALLPELAGKVRLIYIDPPFDTGANFSFTATVPAAPAGDEDDEEVSGGTSFTKQPSVIEQVAYRDTWGRGLDSYLQWFYETVVILRDLLTEDGSIYVHLDWHVAHYSKVILDDVFGYENFRNEIIWYYYNKFQGNINRFASNHDVIFWYSKSNKYQFNKITEKRGETVKQIKRVWSKEKGSIVNAKDSFGQVQYIETDERTIDDVWRLSMLQPADKIQNVNYPTQKPESLVERVIKASSNEGDIVLDCFCGSGTTAATAEKLGRRWVTCDLGRFAIHTARKRLLGIEGVKPFAVQNLGKYERQQWLAHQFSEPAQRAAQEAAYRDFMLQLYRAESLPGYAWLHGRKGRALVHIGSVDAPVTEGDIKATLKEFWQAAGKSDGPQTNTLHILGWEFAFDLNDTAQRMAAQHKVQLSFYQIPREVLEKKAVEQGDISFAELAYVDVQVKQKARTVSLRLNDFVVNPDDVPNQARQAISHWSQYVDYWAVDWDYQGDTFHNQWQSYRTRRQTQLALETPAHLYPQPGTYRVMVKVIDILGNDTTKQFDLDIL